MPIDVGRVAGAGLVARAPEQPAEPGENVAQRLAHGQRLQPAPPKHEHLELAQIEVVDPRHRRSPKMRPTWGLWKLRGSKCNVSMTDSFRSERLTAR